MAASQSTTPDLFSGNSSACRRLKMGYIAGRKGRGRRHRVLGHCVEDASRVGDTEANAAGFREATGDEIIYEAQMLISRRFRPGAKLFSSPEMIEVFLRLYLGPLDHEVFGVILLDSHHRLIAVQNLFRGTADQCAVYTREVVHSVLVHGATAVVLYHNHPLCGFTAVTNCANARACESEQLPPRFQQVTDPGGQTTSSISPIWLSDLRGLIIAILRTAYNCPHE